MAWEAPWDFGSVIRELYLLSLVVIRLKMIHERFARGHHHRYNGIHMKHLLWSVLLLQALAQQPPKAGINLFSLRDDIAIGAESAREANRTLPLVREPAIAGYLNSI